jgi:hypothetical protein
MNVKDFLITKGSDKDRAEFQQYAQETKRLLDEAESQISSPERSAKVREAQSMIDTYIETFGEVENEMANRNRLLHVVLADLGKKIEQGLTDIPTTAFATAILIPVSTRRMHCAMF